MADTTHGDAPLPPQKGQGGLLKWTASMPTHVMSMLNPFANDNDDADADAADADKLKDSTRVEKKEKSDKDGDVPAEAQQSSNKRLSMFASFLPIGFLGGDGPPKKSMDEGKEEDWTMFEEPDTRHNSDDGSREGSIFDELGRHKPKKTKVPKTSYSICHPAPTSTTRQRLHRRPRSMMQLHRLSADKRPRPAFEVIPSANFSVRLTKAITKVFKAKHGLCPNDLVVLRAEKYAAAEDEANEEQDAHDIIALVCKGRPGDATSAGGRARICLPEGREWEAYPTPNGGYEFFSTDEHGLGLTVRWVMKKNKDGSKPTEPLKRRFNFSPISPNSRRHPVIATLSRTGLDVNDTYKIPDPSAVTPLSTPKQGATILGDAMDDDDVPAQQNMCETDQRLQEIIAITSIWVAFKEGWSPFYKYDEKDRDASLGMQRLPSMPAHSPAKSSTFNHATPLSTPPGSPVQTPLQKRSSVKSIGSGIARTGSLLRRGSSDNRQSTVSVPEADEEPASEQQQQQQRTGRSRADSASTVLVHRAASNRRRKNEAVWRPDLLSAQHEAANEDTSVHSTPPSRHARRDSTARPILPSTHHQSDRGAEEVETTTPPPPAEEKRESSATTATASSRSDGAPSKPARTTTTAARKVRSGWRRLLCGSGSDV